MTGVFERLTKLLDERQAEYEVLRHEAVRTSQDAARVRGVPLRTGAKALICRADGQFVHIVLPADLRLASKEIRRRRSLRSLRFASLDEVLELTGLAPGAIPPFGSLFGLPTWCDERLADEPSINFNAGDHAVSIRMPSAEFLRIEPVETGRFGE